MHQAAMNVADQCNITTNDVPCELAVIHVCSASLRLKVFLVVSVCLAIIYWCIRSVFILYIILLLVMNIILSRDFSLSFNLRLLSKLYHRLALQLMQELLYLS